MFYFYRRDALIVSATFLGFGNTRLTDVTIIPASSTKIPCLDPLGDSFRMFVHTDPLGDFGFYFHIDPPEHKDTGTKNPNKSPVGLSKGSKWKLCL